MGDPELNHWKALTYLDPAHTLLEYRKLEIALSEADIDPKVVRLRTAALKGQREARDAAIFALGMSVRLTCPVLFSPTEEADYDFITRTDLAGTSYFTPVQLKELVPEDLNPFASLDALLKKLRAKPVYSHTSLAIRLNRELKQVTFAAHQFDGLPFREVWLFYAASPDARRWRLLGDVLDHPQLTEFEYPL
jgi:hypothetical protein